MRKLFTVCSLLFFGWGALAQKSNRIAGRAGDSITLQPIPFATASILNGKQATIKSVVSDSLGNFVLTGIPAGNYNLVLSAVGYKRVLVKDVILSNTSSLELGLQLLSPEAGLLKEVIVQGSRPTVSASVDGFNYNPENDIVAAGSSAADMLRKVPMVAVDQNGTPTIRGSSNIRVFIDDKPSDIFAPTVADALKQIPAEDIVRVEVILYPSAKYDAEGTDGVINIITRKTRFNAINGNIQSRIGNRQQYVNADMNIRRNSWIFNTNAGVSFNNGLNRAELLREDISANDKNLLIQKGEFDSYGHAVYGGINSIYVINELHAVSAGYRYRTNRNYTDRTAYNAYFLNDSLSTAFTRNSDVTAGNDLNSLNFTCNGKSRDRKRQYSIMGFYFSQDGIDNYDLDQFRQQAIDYKERLRGNQTNKELTVQADFTHSVNNVFTWDAGAKSIFRKYVLINIYEVYDFQSGSYLEDPLRSNEFDYDRTIHGLYSNANLRLGSWQVRGGLRYEQTLLSTVFKDTALSVPDFKNLVPSIVVSKSIGEKHVLKWSYGRRITRPLLNALNPGVNFIDTFNLLAGNPYLQPENTDRYEMSYVYNFKQLFAVSAIYYNNTRNGIEQVRLPLDGGVFLTTYQNIGRNDLLGMYMNITWKWKQKFTGTLTVNLRQYWLESTAMNQYNKGFQYGCNFNLSYNIGKGWGIEATGNINSDDIILQGKRENWKYYGFNFNKKFKGERVGLSMRIENFFPPDYQSLTTSLATSTFKQQSINSYQNPYFLLSFSWKWGKKEVKAPVIREASGEN